MLWSFGKVPVGQSTCPQNLVRGPWVVVCTVERLYQPCLDWDGYTSRHLSASSTVALKSVLPVKVIRAKDLATLDSVSDQDVVRHYISSEQFTHCV